MSRRADDEAEERRRVHRLHNLVGVVAVIAVVALIAGAVALQQRSRASDEADASEIRRLASEAGFQVQFNRQLGLLLAVEAFDLDGGGPVSIGALQRALTGLGSYLGAVENGVPYASVDWLDNETLVAVGPNGTTVIEYETGAVLAAWGEEVKVVRVDPDDGALITRTFVSVANNRVALVPEESPTFVIVRDVTGGSAAPARFAHDLPIHGIALSPEGNLLATIDENDALRMWDVDSGIQLWAPVEAHSEEKFGQLDNPDAVEIYGFEFATAGTEQFPTEKTLHHLWFSSDGGELISQESILRR